MEKILKVSGIFLCMMILICSAFTVAEATTVGFDIGTENSIVDDSGALTIESTMDSSLSNVSFTLSEGQTSDLFSYADIISITVNDDTADTFLITAYLDFVLPDVGVIDNSGEVTVEVKGHCTKGVDTLEIDFDPITVYFGDGGEFIVQIYGLSLLADDDYNSSCCYKPTTGASPLYADVTLVSVPVPEPGTLLLLGSGLVGVAFYARRRKV